MSESVPPDPQQVEVDMVALEGAVERLMREYVVVRGRAEKAETGYQRLQAILRDSQVESGDPQAFEHRMAELTEENARLRRVIDEGRKRAERIRSRLIVVEDESS